MKSTLTNSLASHLECSACKKLYSINRIQHYATCCQKPLIVKYQAEKSLSRSALKNRPNNMWRYAEMLPVKYTANIVTLGEGMTPILPLKNLGSFFGFESLAMKDEGLNPTASFKARGISAAISVAKELGVKECIIPTAGNAGGALSAYGASAGMKVTVVMPRHTPKIFQEECRLFGAHVVLMDGLIDKCGAEVERLKNEHGYFDMSTLKEPYRLEGKKTMGYEIAEQMDWRLPDIIFYPTGGGTGLIGIWKAFQEMMELGWISPPLPRMIAVQSENCAPVMDAFYRRVGPSAGYKSSIANGLAVPNAFGKSLILEVLASSGGDVVSVSEKEIMEGVEEVSSKEGIPVSPEGAAVWMALKKLVRAKQVSPTENVLLLNTGAGYKYFENYY